VEWASLAWTEADFSFRTLEKWSYWFNCAPCWSHPCDDTMLKAKDRARKYDEFMGFPPMEFLGFIE